MSGSSAAATRFLSAAVIMPSHTPISFALTALLLLAGHMADALGGQVHINLARATYARSAGAATAHYPAHIKAFVRLDTAPPTSCTLYDLMESNEMEMAADMSKVGGTPLWTA